MQSEYDALYGAFRQAKEEQDKKKFNYFMQGLESGLISDLDTAYQSGDMKQYQKYLTNIKNQGIRVFRNPDGKHKLKFT